MLVTQIHSKSRFNCSSNKFGSIDLQFINCITENLTISVNFTIIVDKNPENSVDADQWLDCSFLAYRSIIFD